MARAPIIDKTKNKALKRNLKSASNTLATVTTKSNATKTVILRTALREACIHGIEGLTIGELAKAVGMSKSGLFAHFENRDDLQLEVLKLAADDFITQVMKPAFAKPRGEERLKAMFKNWIKHMEDIEQSHSGTLLIAACFELDAKPGRLRDFVKKAQLDLLQNIERAVKMAIDEKQFRKDLSTEQFAWSLYAYVIAYHHSKRMLNDPKAEKHVMDSFKALIEYAKK